MKKLSSKTKLFASALLALLLAFGTGLGALAADYSSGTPEDPAGAAITKLFEMPVGTTTPDAEFTFVVTPIEVDGEDYDGPGAGANMPSVPAPVLVFGAADSGSVDGGIKTIIKETGDIFAGIDWPHAGIFVYEVYEAQSIGRAPEADENFTLSQGLYRLIVYVDNADDGSVYAKYITAERLADDAGETGEDGETEKVDPTPGGGDDYDYSQMTFTNSFARAKDVDDAEDATFMLSKDVAGLGANRELYFSFQVTIGKPAVGVSGDVAYHAVVIDSDGSVLATIGSEIAAAADVGNDGDGDYIIFPAGQTINVSLKHGQKLAFVTLHVGASFTVTELAAAEYIAAYDLVLNGATPVHVDNGTAANQPLTAGPEYVTEGEDYLGFTNTRSLSTPTGINVDILPYIALMLVGMCALVLPAAAKSRRRQMAARAA